MISDGHRQWTPDGQWMSTEGDTPEMERSLLTGKSFGAPVSAAPRDELKAIHDFPVAYRHFARNPANTDGSIWDGSCPLLVSSHFTAPLLQKQPFQ